MAQNRVMFLGAAGQIGQTFQHVFKTMPNAPDWKMGFFTRQDMDMTDPSALRDAVQNFAPELIINSAAMSHIDPAQENEEASTAINFHAVANLAGIASAQDVPIIHLSTDFVFDGRDEKPYLPDDQMNPINNYGGSKMMGEESLRYAMPWHVILRISEVFSAFADNILTHTLSMIDAQDELRIVTDRISAPTSATDVAKTIISIGSQILKGKVDGYGTFHYCGEPSCSRYELTKQIMETYATFTDRHPALYEAKSSDFPEQTPRPAYTVLDCEKIKKIYGIDQPSWKDGLKEAINHLNKRDKNT